MRVKTKAKSYIPAHTILSHFLGKENAPTNPCPIFSNRVYFFLGSPTLTMLPLKETETMNHFFSHQDTKQALRFPKP